MIPLSKRYARWLIGLTLAFLTLAVFAQVAGFGFVEFDDGKYVVDNPHIRQGLTFRSISWAFSTMYFANWHPLTWISYLLDYEIFGLNPMGYHLTNLLFHVLNVCLFFVVLHNLTGSFPRSALVAALFAVHPLHVESVAWVSERKDVLSTFFGILAIRAYHGYVRHPDPSRYLAVATLLALGLMAKPMLVSWPIVLLLLDYWPLQRLFPGRGPGLWSLCIWEKIPLAMLAAISCLLTVIAQYSGGAVCQLESVPFWSRVTNAMVAYQSYLVMTFLPTGLACFYPHPSVLNSETVILAGLLLAGVSVLVMLKSGQHRYLVTGWLWYLITLLPVIGLVQVGEQAMADRYTYVPLIGFFIMVAWGGADLMRGWFNTQRMFLRLGAVIIVGVLAVCAWVQTGYWKNGFSLFGHALEVTAGNWQAHYCLGTTLVQQGRREEAQTHFDEALRLKPGFAPAHNNLGLILAMQGKMEAAMAHFRQALQAQPDYSEAHYNLGSMLVNQGRFDEAVVHLGEAVRIHPDFPAAQFNWGIALEKAGQPVKALAHFAEAVRLKPDLVEARFHCGRILAQQGAAVEAIGQLREALLLEPGHVPTLNELAWLLATNPDATLRNGTEAVELAKRACDLTAHRQGLALSVLAAAQAESERYREAMMTAQEAIRWYRERKNEQRARQVQEQQASYQARRPWRGGPLSTE
jgi:Flp pilus assembly protein TadD